MSSVPARRCCSGVRARAAAVAVASALLSGTRAARAQDTIPRTAGVSVRLAYDPRTRPTLVVLQAPGTLGDSVAAILRRDLDLGDRVVVASVDAGRVAPGGRVDLAAAAQLGAAGVVQPTFTPSGLRLALYDVSARRLVATHDAPLAPSPLSPGWRLGVHAASDEVERWATGVRGIAATRVLYVRGDGRVWGIDSDGANARPVSEGDVRAFSPAWMPSGRGVVYSTLDTDGTQRIVARGYDVATGAGIGAPRTIARGGVVNLTPTVSPDGETVVYAHGGEEGTDLYAVPIDGGAAQRVTVGRGAENVSPTFSPDGRRIAFTSGRTGHPEVYISDADGTNPELLTDYDYSARNYRSNPSWSPDGRLVAFQALVRGQFQVCTIEVRGRAVRCVTTEGRNEDPSWAPDSRHLVYTSTRGTPQLVVLDVETGRSRVLTAGGAARMPAWSPPLR